VGAPRADRGERRRVRFRALPRGDGRARRARHDRWDGAGARERMVALMDDAQIHGSIDKLVAEEHQLWEREAAGEATDADRQRLESLRVSLDQCWDLLRQRRARREAGGNPDAAEVRPADVVEHYEQ